MAKDWQVKTQAVHAGEREHMNHGATIPPIHQASSYAAGADQPFSAEDLDEKPPFIYTRWGNPTVAQLEEKLCALDNAEAAACYGSGMGALTTMFFGVLKPKDHVVCTNVCYPGVIEFMRDFCPRMDIEVSYVDASRVDEVTAAVRDNTSLIFIETPANPIIRLADIAAIAEVAKAAGALLAVDNTFGSPMATRPIDLGADIVCYSLTKYHGGHGDALGGAVLGGATLIDDIRYRVGAHLGPTMAPFNAWLIMRGMGTLPLRMRAHETAAMAVAEFLEQHPKVLQVTYPGLPSHPQHELAKQQMDNFSGMMSFRVDDAKTAATRMDERFEVIHYAVSLGHHKSLCYYVDTAAMIRSTYKLEGEHLARYKAFAGDGLFRMSVGIEDPLDLITDLERALA